MVATRPSIFATRVSDEIAALPAPLPLFAAELEAGAAKALGVPSDGY